MNLRETLPDESLKGIHASGGEATLPMPLDGSMAKTAVRLAYFGLGALALLPPLIWSLAITVLGAAEGPGWHSGGWVALGSLGVAVALWVGLLRRPVEVLQQEERRMRVLDKRDPLTGLPNRGGLRVAMARALRRCSGTRSFVGVLMIDLDRFHVVNDSLGPAAGDELLRSVASRIRAVVRAGDLVARLGVDQFAVQVEGVISVQALHMMARNLSRAMQFPHSVSRRETVATVSIGLAMSGEQAITADALLKHAEIAMRVAKSGGGAQFCSFDPSMEIHDRTRLDMEHRLRRATADAQFQLAFQPIVDAKTGRISAVEALMRWTDAVHGVVSPARFIPVLEQTGMIVDAGSWVLREACRIALGWNTPGAHSLLLSVNVSPRQFAEARFVQTVETILAETGFPASRLQLEVTEGLLLEPSPDTLRKIDVLARMGVQLAVDDFGMGYSSLAYLKTFPLHCLKIDRVFVRDMALHERDAAIIRAIIDLGHGLGLKITAEGVETEEQVEALRALGCDTLQGFLFSRPLDAGAMQALLEPGAPARAPDAPSVVPVLGLA
jgi:diguanylate cyclase (GGDEF)-like protein